MSKAIVITHGLFMKKEVMIFLHKEFEKLGYQVYNFGYDTRKFSGETIEKFKNYIVQIPEPQVYFVGHSLGGLLIRRYFESYNPSFEDTCIITLGTPHKGSSLGKKVQESIFSGLIGSASTSGMVNGLPEWDSSLADLGCIVGVTNIGVNNLFNIEKGAGDGTVLVSEAVCDNAKDVIEVNSNHTALIYSKTSVKLVDNFIKTRSFQ